MPNSSFLTVPRFVCLLAALSAACSGYTQPAKTDTNDVLIEKVIPFAGNINGKAGILELHYTYRSSTMLGTAKNATAEIYKYRKKDGEKVVADLTVFSNKQSGLIIPADGSVLQGPAVIIYRNDSIYTCAQRPALCSRFPLKAMVRNCAVQASVRLITADSSMENPFSGEQVPARKIVSLTITVDDRPAQLIGNVNEIAGFSSDPRALAETGVVKMEDYNNDGYLDLWVRYRPTSTLYDTDYVIYVYDAKRKMFGSRKFYELKNIPDAVLRKRWTGK